MDDVIHGERKCDKYDEPQQFCLYQTVRCCCFGPSSWSTWPTRAVRTLWRGPDSFRAVLIQSRIGNTDSLLHLAVFIASRLPPPCSILHKTQIQRRGDAGKVDMQSWLIHPSVSMASGDCPGALLTWSFHLAPDFPISIRENGQITHEGAGEECEED